MLLAEPTRDTGRPTLDLLSALAGAALRQDAALQSAVNLLRSQIDDESRLVDVLRRYPVVLGFHLSNEVGAVRTGKLPAPLLPAPLLREQTAGLPHWAGHGGNLAALQGAARLGAGHLNAIVDPDGRVRRLPVLIEHEGGVHGSLALVMARALLGAQALAGEPANASQAFEPENVKLAFEPASGPWQALRLRSPAGDLRLPLDAQATTLLPFSAPGTGFVRYPAADVLAQRLPANALRGKLVLVG